MKHILITIIAAVVLVGCGKSRPTEPPIAKAPDISIHDAAKIGNIEAIKQHIGAGTEVNAKNKGGMRLPPFFDHGSAFLRWNLPCPCSVL